MKVALCVAVMGGLALSASGQALSKRYKGALDDKPRPLEWSSTIQDVWKLSAFELERGSQLELKCGPAALVVGASGGAAIWAFVEPATPVALSGSLAPEGAALAHLLVRFHPAQLDELFPPKTVGKAPDARALLAARRVVARQLTETGYRWDQFPTALPKGSLVLDCTFVDGARRVFQLDASKGVFELDSRFTRSELPAAIALSSKDAERAFEAAWEAFDRQYAKFQLRPEVDWDAVRKSYAPLARGATTTWEAATAIALALEPLRDLHVHVECGEERLPFYWRYRPQNGVPDAAGKLTGELRGGESGVRWARTDDGIGFLQVNGVGSDEVVQRVDAALEELADTWGLILDIRFNGGGSTNVAASVAGRFIEAEKVYAQSQYRSGSKRTQLGVKQPRTVAPRGPWRYQAPVMALFGQRCMSSGDELALMLVQCPQVTTLGDRTAGSSAAPKLVDVGSGISVKVPQWNDCDAAGAPYEDRGVPVKIALTNAAEAFTLERDPVLEAALERLRASPKNKRAPGKR
jgi:hypothetical protein